MWEKGHQLTLAVYRATRKFPREELYGLTSQMRRAAASIPTNLAEGCCRSGDADFARFAQIAMGSAGELKYQCVLARDLGFIENTEGESLIGAVDEVQRMLTSLIQTLRNKRPKG